MAERIRVVGKRHKILRDTSPRLPRVEPREIQKALGAEPAGATLKNVVGPITMFLVRQETVRRLQSSEEQSTGVPLNHQANVSLKDQEWRKLEELATLISSPEFTPSAEQVASVLLSLSLDSVASQILMSPKPSASPLVRELADRVPLGLIST